MESDSPGFKFQLRFLSVTWACSNWLSFSVSQPPFFLICVNIDFKRLQWHNWRHVAQSRQSLNAFFIWQMRSQSLRKWLNLSECSQGTNVTHGLKPLASWPLVRLSFYYFPNGSWAKIIENTLLSGVLKLQRDNIKREEEADVGWEVKKADFLPWFCVTFRSLHCLSTHPLMVEESGGA